MRPQSKVFTSAEETLHRLTTEAVLKRHELLHRTEQGTRAAQSRAQMHLRPIRADLASNCNRNKPVAPNSHKTSEIKEQTNHTRCQFALTNTSRCDSKQLINIAVRKLNIRTSANSGRGPPNENGATLLTVYVCVGAGVLGMGGGRVQIAVSARYAHSSHSGLSKAADDSDRSGREDYQAAVAPWPDPPVPTEYT